MTVQIQLRRGTAAEWTAVGNTVVLAAGEPGLDTTNNQVRYGDGTSVWNALPIAAGGGSAGPIALADLTDVAAIVPITGQVLKWSGVEWAPGNETGGGAGPTVLADLDDVSAITPTLDQVLAWNGIFWSPATISGGGGLSSVSQDLAPALGGNLSVGAFAITSTNNITLTPTNFVNLNGNVVVNNYQTALSRDGGNNTILLSINQHSDSEDYSSHVTMGRSRGTSASRLAVQVGDSLHKMTSSAWNGSAWSSTASFRSIVEEVSGSAIRSKYIFQTIPASSRVTTAELSAAGIWKVNQISALTTNANLVLSGNGSGVVELPAGSTIGGVVIGTGSGSSALSIRESVADSTALSAVTGMASGDAYVVLSPAPSHLWSYNGTSWLDLGEFQGPTGATGPAGATGATGPAGADSVVAGPQGPAGADGVGIPVGGTAGQVLAKIDDTNYNTQWVTQSGGGGAGLTARSVVSASTGSLDIGATSTASIIGFKGYALLKMLVSQAAWVRVYVSDAARAADAARLEGTDPTPGSGVIAEVITTGANQTVLISPGTIGFSDEATPTTAIPIRVTNKSGAVTDITVALTVLQLEA